MSSSHPRARTFPFTASILSGALLALLLLVGPSVSLAEMVKRIPPPVFSDTKAPSARTEKAVLAGGCFWGIQGVYQHVKGVKNAVSGYAGGAGKTAEYETVGTGRTGHAESVEITFDPNIISYGTLLQIYFSVAHDPTQLNRQGPDAGTQYRSAIFAQNASQRAVATNYIEQLNQAHVFGAPIKTKVESSKRFYPAEAYHQNYATLHPESSYIATYDLPKIEALRAFFPDLYRPQPRLVADAG